MRALVAVSLPILLCCIVVATLAQWNALAARDTGVAAASISSPPSNNKCLLIISTSAVKQDGILKQYETYDPNLVGLWLNIYDNTNTSTIREAVHTTGSIIKSSIPGLKPSFWKHVTRQHVEGYNYLYFLDDDMIFDRRVFAFEQFLFLAVQTDAVISSPKIIIDRNPRSAFTPSAVNREGKVTGSLSAIIRNKKKQEQNNSSSTTTGGKGWDVIPQGTIQEESVISKIAARVKNIEQGSFLFKTDAWHFFLDEIFFFVKGTDCGVDCVWCRVFEREGTRFGRVPCMRAQHLGIMHSNTASHTGTLSFSEYNDMCHPAIRKYFDRVKTKYGMESEISMCRDKSQDFISLDSLALSSA